MGHRALYIFQERKETTNKKGEKKLGAVNNQTKMTVYNQWGAYSLERAKHRLQQAGLWAGRFDHDTMAYSYIANWMAYVRGNRFCYANEVMRRKSDLLSLSNKDIQAWTQKEVASHLDTGAISIYGDYENKRDNHLKIKQGSFTDIEMIFIITNGHLVEAYEHKYEDLPIGEDGKQKYRQYYEKAEEYDLKELPPLNPDFGFDKERVKNHIEQQVDISLGVDDSKVEINRRVVKLGEYIQHKESVNTILQCVSPIEFMLYEINNGRLLPICGVHHDSIDERDYALFDITSINSK